MTVSWLSVKRPRRGVGKPSRAVTMAAMAAVCGLLGAGLTACGDDDSSAAGGSEVVMLTHDSFELPESVYEAFTEETGLTLKVIKSGDAGALASTISLTPGKPKADVVFGIDNTFASRPIENGALEPYKSPAAVDGASAYAVADSNNELTAVTRGDVCLNLDDSWFEKHDMTPPKSFRDLTDAKYANLSALLDPGTSSPGMAFLLTTVNADPRGWQEYWKKMVVNKATIVSGWEIAYNQLFSAGEGRGQKPIVLSYASSPAATPGTSALLDSCFGQVEYVGILKGAKNVEGARKVVDFMLSQTVQRELPSSMYVYPVQKGTPLPDGWQQRAPVPAWTIKIPPAVIAKNREQWLQQWRDAVGR